MEWRGSPPPLRERAHAHRSRVCLGGLVVKDGGNRGLRGSKQGGR